MYVDIHVHECKYVFQFLHKRRVNQRKREREGEQEREKKREREICCSDHNEIEMGKNMKF